MLAEKESTHILAHKNSFYLSIFELITFKFKKMRK